MTRIKPVMRCVAVAFGGSIALASLAYGQDTQKQERIEVTGSSIKRIDAESALPVSVIKREDIEKTGASNVSELVERLTYNNGGGRSIGESLGESSAPGQSGASLRGLGRDRTLVLLNGRRLAVYPFTGSGVDLNSIPLAAVERIEILRDGASAVYGSDAIGGVINFITRRDYKGAEANLSYEQPQMKGGKVTGISGGFGFGDLAKDRFNVLGTVNYEEYTVIKAADRDYARTGVRPDIGIVSSSGNTFPANAFIATTGQYVPGAAGFPNCNPPDSFRGAANCRYDFTSKIDIYPASKRTGLFLRANFQLNSDNLLFAESSYSKNEIIYGISQTPSVTTGKPPYFYPGGGRYYPTAAVDAVLPGYRGDLRISWRIVDGGQRKDQVTNELNRFLIGAEGTIGGWDYKAGAMQVSVKAKDTYIDGLFSDTALRAALRTGNVNPFGPNDAAGLALLEGAKIRADIRNSKTTSDVWDLRASRELMPMAGGPVAMALGTEWRSEKYSDGYTPISSSGDIVGGSGNQGPVAAKRNAFGVFTEFSLPFAKGWEAQVAVRHDSYGSASSSTSRAGNAPSASSTNPKLSVRWQPNKEFLVRASAGTGFRMPTLDNLYFPSSFTNTGGQFTDPFYNTIRGCAAFPNTDYCDTQLTTENNSNPNLKPEKSKQFTLGVLYEPTRDFSIGVDYFDIKITNGITALTGDDVMIDWYRNRTGPTTSSSVYANRLIRDPATGFLDYIRGSLENIGKARVAGFDMTAKGRFKTAYGTFSPSWEGTYLTKSTTTNIVTGVESSNLGRYARGGPAVRLKQLYSLEWSQGAWASTVRYYVQSGYEDYSGTRNVGRYELWDLLAQYKGIKNLTVTGGVRNLFNRKPPVTDTQDYFQVGFDPTYADVKGRTYYLKLNYKFW
jgi:iron complex outermembrane receptor protein